MYYVLVAFFFIEQIGFSFEYECDASKRVLYQEKNNNKKILKKSFMAPFYGRGSTVSRL